MDFVTTISDDILARKKMQVEDYINYILSESQPLDEIAICCFARMYHLHVEITMDSMFWTTCQDHDFHKCDKLLGFIGSLNFVSIRWKTTSDENIPEPEPEPGTSQNYTGKIVIYLGFGLS